MASVISSSVHLNNQEIVPSPKKKQEARVLASHVWFETERKTVQEFMGYQNAVPQYFNVAVAINKIHISPGNVEVLTKKKFTHFVDNRPKKWLDSLDKNQRHFGFIVCSEKKYLCHQIPVNLTHHINTVFCVLTSETFESLPAMEVYKKVASKKHFAVEFLKDNAGTIKKIFVAKKWTEQDPNHTLSAIGLCQFLEGRVFHTNGNLTHYRIIDMANAELVPINEVEYTELVEKMIDIPFVKKGSEDLMAMRAKQRQYKLEESKKTCWVQ